jgi:hypothetical protein
VLQGRYMAVDFAADLQQELDYFAGPFGMGVDGFYIDCTRTSAEWSLARWQKVASKAMPGAHLQPCRLCHRSAAATTPEAGASGTHGD